MSDLKKRFLQLYRCFLDDTATPEQLREFWKLAGTMKDEEMMNAIEEISLDDQSDPEESGAWNTSIPTTAAGQQTVRIRPYARWMVAAGLAIAIALGIQQFRPQQNSLSATANSEIEKAQPVAPDVKAPTASYATVTLADGRTVALDSADAGLLAMQAGIAVTKTSDGSLRYTAQISASDIKPVYNTVTNPRGSRAVSMVLSDGSRVWLNAASSITFPVVFTPDQRSVEISGEAYFEVRHDASRKFLVKSNGMTAEVLGTSFNVNSYEDEGATRITLVEGSVRVSYDGGAGTVIKPGEQAVGNRNTPMVIHRTVRVQDVIAWKNEKFSFQDENIRSIMREISRWYDVDIEYKGRMDDLNFGGSMSRQNNVSELLKRLEATQAVRFAVEGSKISVIRKQ